jgi:hypothetical protein
MIHLNLRSSESLMWMLLQMWAPANFSTELLHPRLRSSVRRISVPSQTAEVSS